MDHLTKFALLGLLGLSGCAQAITVSRTGAKQTPRESNCAFEVFTSVPAQGYREIAVIDVHSGPYGDKRYTELPAFTTEITPYVCEAGGDATVGIKNSNGIYIQATVLKRQQPSQPVAPAEPSGCTYDTQCKGDRICVEGKCTEPQAPSAPPVTDIPPSSDATHTEP